MRPGWELAFTKFKVDTSRTAKLVYKVSGGEDDEDDRSREWGEMTPLAFHKPLLYMIRTHLGIEMKDIVRIDDGSKEFCYEFKVYAEYLGVDGQVHSLVDQGGLDLSDTSLAYKTALANNDPKRRQKAMANIEKRRAKVLQLATTNAEERVIVSYGFRGSYSKGELDSKYIVCVRPLYTGYHPDPEIQKLLVQDMLTKSDHASAVLFGSGSTAPTRRLPPLAIPDSMLSPEVIEPPKECTSETCFGEGAKHLTKTRPDGKILNYCSGDLIDAPAETAPTSTAPDPVVDLFKSQIAKINARLQEETGIPEAEALALMGERKTLTEALEKQRAG